MAKDRDSGTTFVQKLLTYSLIGLIVYIYFTDYRPGSETEVIEEDITPSVEVPVFLSVKPLFGNGEKDLYQNFDQKITIELSKEQINQLINEFEKNSSIESFPIFELEYIEGMEGIATQPEDSLEINIEADVKEDIKENIEEILE